MYMPELQEKINGWVASAKAGTMTKEELKAALAYLREGRTSAAGVSAKSRASKAPVDAEALLKEFL